MSRILGALAGVCLTLAGEASAQVSSADLIEHAAQHSGQPVEYVGEVIGDPMIRGDHLWVNVSDGQNAIGVWVARRDLPPIGRYGSYQARGDLVTVRGTFFRACPEHGGDLDLHASSVVVVRPGAATPHDTEDSSIAWAGVLLATSIVSFLLWRRREKAVRAAQAASRAEAADPDGP
jgi:LPXTG-motif cell wall-anchored protein